ncbi:hypothetical protein N9I56_04920 [Alphaproteobacteria bacterium]|nr:hypothetical protein [Alphaproteobacteria bacterium]
MRNYFSYEKWNIATTSSTIAELIEGKWHSLHLIDHQNKWENAADPFYWNKDIYFEEFNYCNKGKIVKLNLKSGERETVFSPDHHVSFPTRFESGFLVESATRNILTFLNQNWEVVRTETSKSSSYLDPVIYDKGGVNFLFSSKHGTKKHSVLNVSRLNSEGEWENITDKPACNSQFGGRMAGQILDDQKFGRLRFGQVSCPKYGSGIAVHRITCLEDFRYSEEFIGEIKPPTGFDGIHTINKCEQGYVVDLRTDTPFSVLKVMQLVKKRFNAFRKKP